MRRVFDGVFSGRTLKEIATLLYSPQFKQKDNRPPTFLPEIEGFQIAYSKEEIEDGIEFLTGYTSIGGDISIGGYYSKDTENDVFFDLPNFFGARIDVMRKDAHRLAVKSSTNLNGKTLNETNIDKIARNAETEASNYLEAYRRGTAVPILRNLQLNSIGKKYCFFGPDMFKNVDSSISIWSSIATDFIAPDTLRTLLFGVFYIRTGFLINSAQTG